MRKLVYALFVVVYLLLSSGVVLQLHYCMDRLAEVGLFVSDHDDVCGDCGMGMGEDNDCCQDQTDVVKLVQDQTFHALAQPLPKSPATDLLSNFPTPQELGIKMLPAGARPNPDHPATLGRYRYRTLEVFRI